MKVLNGSILCALAVVALSGCKQRSFNADSKKVAAKSEGDGSREFVYSLKGDIVTRNTCPFNADGSKRAFKLSECVSSPATRKWKDMSTVLRRLALESQGLEISRIDREIDSNAMELQDNEDRIKMLSDRLKSASLNEVDKATMKEQIVSTTEEIGKLQENAIKLQAQKDIVLTGFKEPGTLEPLLKDAKIYTSESQNHALQQYSDLLFRAFVEAPAFQVIWSPSSGKTLSASFDIHDYATIWHLKARSSVSSFNAGAVDVYSDEIPANSELYCWTDGMNYYVNFNCGKEKNAPMMSNYSFQMTFAGQNASPREALDALSKYYDIKAVYR